MCGDLSAAAAASTAAAAIAAGAARAGVSPNPLQYYYYYYYYSCFAATRSLKSNQGLGAAGHALLFDFLAPSEKHLLISCRFRCLLCGKVDQPMKHPTFL
jgi:hypothetical protein